MDIVNTPYTYLIICKTTNQWYYGVRYAKRCHPQELWKTYFTSSKYVNQLIQQYGKANFYYEVRKIFENKHEAVLWESKVLKRIKAVSRIDCLNKYDHIYYDSIDRIWIKKQNKTKFIDILFLEEYLCNGWELGRLFSDSHKEKISKSNMGKKYSLGFKFSKESKLKMSKSRTKLNSKKVIYNGIQYNSIKEACIKTGLSYKKIKKFGVFQ